MTMVRRRPDLFGVRQFSRKFLRGMDQRGEALCADPEIMSSIPECKKWSVLFRALAADAA
jgi:hypothetical protein